MSFTKRGPSHPIAQEAAEKSYEGITPDGWEFLPRKVQRALDLISQGRAGVCLVSAVEPANPADGQAWLNTGDNTSNGVWTFQTVTANTTLIVTDPDICEVDASGGPVTITMPLTTARGGKAFDISKIDSSANAVTIVPAGAETIIGAASFVLLFQYESVPLYANDTRTEWGLR